MQDKHNYRTISLYIILKGKKMDTINSSIFVKTYSAFIYI